MFWFLRIRFGPKYFLTLSRLLGEGAESARDDFKCRCPKNGYSYDSKISCLFVEIHYWVM